MNKDQQPRFLADRLLEEQEIDRVAGAFPRDADGIGTCLDFDTFSGSPTTVRADDSNQHSD